MLRKPLTIMALAVLAVAGSHDHAPAQPDTVWTRWYGGASDEEAYSVQQTEDGGFIIVGYTTTFGGGGKDVWLLKIDSYGDTLWTKTYGGPQDDIGRSVRQTSEGGYIIAGQTNSFGAGNADLWLIKTDADGDSLWAKTYGGSANDVGNSIRQTQDGGYIIVGTNASFSAYYDDVWLLKTDSAGDTLWTKSWDVNNNDDRGTEVQQTYDGGFVVVGHSYTFSGSALYCTLFKTDSQGSLLWMESYGERIDQRGASVDQTSDSGYVLTGYTAHSGMTNPDVYVVKTDSVGDTTWTRTYGGSGWEEGYLVRQTTEGGYFIAGKTNSFGAGGFDVWILETDSNGDTLWAKAYGGTSDDVAYSGQETADEEYIIAGYTQSFGGGGRDVYIIRLAYRVPRILSTSPAQNDLNVSLSTNISVTFDIDMDETTINNSTFVVNARSSGPHPGTITYDSPTKTATFDPFDDFQQGELVSAVLTTGIRSSSGVHLDSSYVWCFTAAVDGGSGIFATDSTYPADTLATSVCAADFDNDGDLDLACANDWTNRVSVLLNQGDGTFAPQSQYPVGGSHPVSICAADLDGDGDIDLTTANDHGTVSVIYNLGNGTFDYEPWVWSIPDVPPLSICAADLDGDGDMDLATANGDEHMGMGSVSVLVNNGNYEFNYHWDSFPWVIDCYYSICAADLDADGDLDLAAGTDFDIFIFSNNGDATFMLDSTYDAGSSIHSVSAADLNGDGYVDLAAANHSHSQVTVLLNQGDGTFSAPSAYGVDNHPISVFAADLEGDGDVDLATANERSDNVSVLLNNGDGTFITYASYPVGIEPLSVCAADLDGDGDLDLATANSISFDISVLLNVLRGDANGNGAVEPGDVVYLINYLFRNDPPPDPYLTGDCNCDGEVGPGDVVYLINYLFRGWPPPSC
jgi:hypothetical protein